MKRYALWILRLQFIARWMEELSKRCARRRATVLGAKPNAGHRAIAAMADHVPQFTLITQNVDDLHERAGSQKVLHLHGELSRPFCEACRRPYPLAEGIPEFPPGGARVEKSLWG